MTAPRSLRTDRSGAVALETALVMTFFLVPLLTAIVGIGQALMIQQRLDRALHAALMYGWGTPTATAATLRTAAQAGYGPKTPAMTAAASISCYCIALATGARATAPVICGTACLNNQVQGTYATVSLSAAMTPVLTLNFGGAAWTLTAAGMARLQ